MDMNHNQAARKRKEAVGPRANSTTGSDSTSTSTYLATEDITVKRKCGRSELLQKCDDVVVEEGGCNSLQDIKVGDEAVQDTAVLQPVACWSPPVFHIYAWILSIQRLFENPSFPHRRRYG